MKAKQKAPSFRYMGAVTKHLIAILGDDFAGTDIEKPLNKMYVPIELTNYESDEYVAHQYIVKHYGENGALYV